MRLEPFKTLSARIIGGYVVLILTFGAVSALTVLSMERLSREIRDIRTAYLPLALIAKDLAEKQVALRSYLTDDLTAEPTPSRVQARIRGYRAGRGSLLREAAGIVAGLEGLPGPHRRRIQYAVDELRELVEQQDALYSTLLAAPPIDRMTAIPPPGPPEERAKLAAATAALERLRLNERRLYNKTWAFQRQQEEYAARTALRLERNERRLRLYTLYLGITAMTVGLLITVWATLTLRPIRRLRDAARRIARGDYASRIDESGPTEVAELAREFNVMGRAVEERERELVRSERLAAVGKMAAMITHEVRNPLSSIGLNTELLEEELAALPPEQAEEARSLCRAITGEVDRLTAITEEYLQFARLPKPRLQVEAINPIVDSFADFEHDQLALRGVTLERDLAADLPAVMVDEAQVRQALHNLVRNAADAVEEVGGGTVRLITRPGQRDGMVEVRIADDGPGITADLAPKLFDPFFSTKEGGTGLGLALTHQIVREHGGDIVVQSRPGHGATFVVSLPVAAAG